MGKNMKKCLVIDDVEVSRYTVKVFLEEAGIEMLEAADGKEALDVLESQNVDFILLDWHLKKKSGLDLLEVIRKEKGEHLPVVVFSGVEGEGKREEAIKAGANGFILKPTTKEALNRVMEEIGIK